MRCSFIEKSFRATCSRLRARRVVPFGRAVGGGLGGRRRGASSVNDRHSSVCEREGTPSHGAPGQLNFQLSIFSIAHGSWNFANSELLPASVAIVSRLWKLPDGLRSRTLICLVWCVSWRLCSFGTSASWGIWHVPLFNVIVIRDCVKCYSVGWHAFVVLPVMSWWIIRCVRSLPWWHIACVKVCDTASIKNRRIYVRQCVARHFLVRQTQRCIYETIF